MTLADQLVEAQAHTSAATNVNTLPKVFRSADFEKGGVNADIGGGKYDTATKFLARKGVKNHVSDPYNRSGKENAKAAAATQGGKADTATVANVLNVIKEPDERAKVIRKAANRVGTKGVAYFSVYEGDGSGQGKKTPKGWQENRKLASYAKEIGRAFKHVKVRGSHIEAHNRSGEQQEEARISRDEAKRQLLRRGIHAGKWMDVPADTRGWLLRSRMVARHGDWYTLTDKGKQTLSKGMTERTEVSPGARELLKKLPMPSHEWRKLDQALVRSLTSGPRPLAVVSRFGGELTRTVYGGKLLGGRYLEHDGLVEKRAAMSRAALKLYLGVKSGKVKDEDWWEYPLKVRQELLARGLVTHREGPVQVTPLKYHVSSVEKAYGRALTEGFVKAAARLGEGRGLSKADALHRLHRGPIGESDWKRIHRRTRAWLVKNEYVQRDPFGGFIRLTEKGKRELSESIDEACGRALTEGFVKRRADGKWCVHNEPTGLVVKTKDGPRCYESREEALQTWYQLDCKYTGRHCGKIRGGVAEELADALV